MVRPGRGQSHGNEWCEVRLAQRRFRGSPCVEETCRKFDPVGFIRDGPQSLKVGYLGVSIINMLIQYLMGGEDIPYERGAMSIPQSISASTILRSTVMNNHVSNCNLIKGVGRTPFLNPGYTAAPKVHVVPCSLLADCSIIPDHARRYESTAGHSACMHHAGG